MQEDPIDAGFSQMASDDAYQEEAVQIAESFAEADWEALQTGCVPLHRKPEVRRMPVLGII